MRALLVVLSGLMAGCGGLSEVSTAVFALGDLPPDVQSISLFIASSDSGQVVATATLAAPQSRVALGVPAEVALQMTAVARSQQPAHASLGGRMPVYVARSTRTVPLGNEAFIVELQARPAGGLTVLLEGPDEGGDLELRFEGAQPSRDLLVSTRVKGTRFIRVLPTGVWSLQSESPGWVIEGGKGLWIEPGVHTLAHLQIVEEQPGLPVGEVHRLRIEVRSDDQVLGDLIATSSIGPSELEVSVVAVDALGIQVSLSDADVELLAVAVPTELLAQGETMHRGLPARFSGLSVSGVGRLRVVARAQLAEGPALYASWHANIGRPGGIPARLDLQVEDESRLVGGTRLEARLLDSAGHYAEAMSWRLDISQSDPWAYFEDGVLAQIQGPVGRVRLARPSGPLGLRVGLKAVVTSTVFEGTLTSSLALPLGPIVQASRGSGE